MDHYCYILVNEANTKTYAGYTVNPPRRIRQHNGEISGGARRTHNDSWNFAIIVESKEFTKNTALSFEWHLKTHNRKKVFSNIHPLLRRAELLNVAVELEKFKDIQFTIYVNDSTLIWNERITVKSLDEFLSKQ